MANMTLSGYLASAASVTFSGTQTLNSLADNEYTDLSDEIDNSTNKYAFADFYLEMGSVAFTGVDSGYELFIIPCVDGTNYPTWTGNGTSDETENALFYAGFAGTTASTASQKMVFRQIPLPSGKWKCAIRSRANVAGPASGNTLYWRPWSYAI